MIELKIRLKSPQISIKNGLIPETHSKFPQGENNESMDYGIKSVANYVCCTISPWSMLGYLRFGITEALIEKGISVCSSFDLNNVSKSDDYQKLVLEDTTYGYHRKVSPKSKEKSKDGNVGKPECEVILGKQCMVSEIFGGFAGNHRTFSLMPIKVSPVDSEYTRGVKNVTGKGNFLQLSISPRSAVDGTPYTTHNVNVIENLDAILYIKMYEPNPRMDIHIAAILMGIDYLNKHKDEFKHQLGGSRTFGSGFIEPTILPITLTREETVKYHSSLIKIEDKAENDTSSSIKQKIDDWEVQKQKYNLLLDNELKIQKETFGIDKKWWKIG